MRKARRPAAIALALALALQLGAAVPAAAAGINSPPPGMKTAIPP